MDTSNNSELVSRREYARRKGWAPSYVVTLCQQGRISTWVACPGCGARVNARDAACDCGQPIAGAVDFRRSRIEPALADVELAQMKDPAKTAVSERWAARRSEVTSGAPTGHQTVPPEGPDGMSYARAKALLEANRAALAQLDYQQKSGQLVSIDAVRQQVFAKGREARDALQNARARLVPLLAAESDPLRIDQLLADELERISEALGRPLMPESSTRQH